MEISCKNDVNKQLGFTALNMSLLADIIWYGQIKYNQHNGGYTNVMCNTK